MDLIHSMIQLDSESSNTGAAWDSFYDSLDPNTLSTSSQPRGFVEGEVDDDEQAFIDSLTDEEAAARADELRSMLRLNINPNVAASLGNPVVDPSGIFERIGAPTLRNMDSLLYWFQVRLITVRSAGWSGGVQDIWINLLARQGQNDRAMLSLSSYVALKCQAAMVQTSDVQQHILRAKGFVIQELQGYHEVSALLLVVIARLSLASIAEGDYGAADAHLKALGKLYRDDIVFNDIEWMFVWGTDLAIASTLQRPPCLPYCIPPDLAKPFTLPSDEISMCHRLAAGNSMSLSSALGDDYLLVSRVFEGLHLAYTAYSHPPTDTLDLSVYGRLYMLVYQSSSFFEICRQEVGCAGTFLAAWKQILATALELASWHSTIYHLPPEGFLQANLLKYAASVLKKAGEVDYVIDMWCVVADVDSLLWCATILIMEASLHLESETHLWIDVLRRAIRKSDISSPQEFESLLAQWPHDPRRLEHIVEKL